MVTIFKDPNELTAHAADIFISAAQDAIAAHGRFVVALTGGTSPKGIYQLLTTYQYQSKIDWSKVFIFWSDERWVLASDNRSNAKMAFENFLSHTPIPEENIFTMHKDGITAENYAAEYEQIIKRIAGKDGRFDLIMLGMGDDGHTASLFPGEAVLHEEHKWVDAYYLEPQSMYRITFTAPFINNAKQVMIVTFGKSKTNALREVLYGEYNPEKYPAQLIKPVNGKLHFLADKDAIGI